MKQILSELIKTSGGSIPFVEFMRQALYHPEKGYYRMVKKRLGPGGDFITAPEITSLFGELIALQMIELWQLMGSPEKFQLVEMGPGSGRLARDILATAKRFATFYDALSYELVEISEDFRTLQEESLRQAGVIDKARWHRNIESAAGIDGVVGAIFGNEFLDALPVHWLEQTGEGLVEVGVVLDENGGFATTARPLSPEVPDDYFNSRGIELAEGTRTEVGLVGQEWMEQAAGLLRQGIILMIDYGHPQKEYYAPQRINGTLAGHMGHVRIDDPLANPGEMDLTAHVDFSAILQAGKRGGLELLGYTTQGWFLLGLGILERLEMLSKMEGVRMSDLKESVMRLTLPEGMGETFKVLALGRAMGECKLSGFRLNEQSKRL